MQAFPRPCRQMAALMRACTFSDGIRHSSRLQQAPTARVAAPCRATAEALSVGGQVAVVGVHSLRCTIVDLPGNLADAMSDELLGLGAQSAR